MPKLHGERPVGAERPQPHVDAEHVAVGGHFVQHRDQPAREADEELVVAQRPRAARFAFFGVNEHEVDVGRYVEFAAAELAHGDDMQLLLAPAVFPDRLPVFRRQPAFEMRDRGRDRDIGERGDRGNDFVERRQPAQIARDQAQHHALAQVSQYALKRCFVRCVCGGELGTYFVGAKRRAHARRGQQTGLGRQQPTREAR